MIKQRDSYKFSPLRRTQLFKSLLFLVTWIFLYFLWKSSEINNPSSNIKDLIRVRNDWQNVGYDKTFSIYSAYSFLNKQVEIITSYKRFSDKENVHCKFYFENDKIPAVQTPATIERIHGWDYVADFTGHQVQCQLPPRTKESPNYPVEVSVLVGNQINSPARVTIQYRESTGDNNGILDSTDRKYDFTFSVCVKPVHNGSNELLHFLEWFEFYKMMGVQQFTLYNMSMGTNLGCLMTHLQKLDNKPKVNVFPWNNYPIIKNVEYPNTFEGKGKSEAFQDCLFRHKGGRSKYLINVDLDEFIMPRENIRDYPELLETLEAMYQNHSDKKMGEYVFKNGFFILDRIKSANLGRKCESLIGNRLEYRICQNLWMMAYVRREPYSLFGHRTKNIMIPDAVRVSLNHFVEEFEPGYGSVNVPPEIAFSRHYRYFEKEPRFKIDAVPKKVGVELAENVAKTLEGVMKVCNIKESDIFQEI